MACICGRDPVASVYPVIDPNSLMAELPHRYGYGFHQDGIMITVEDDPTLTRCEMRVILTTPPNVTWRKELHAWNYCNASSLGMVATEDANHGPSQMIITRGACTSGTSTILFKKIAWNRIMYNMYTLNPDELWAYWGGKKVTFDWEFDNRGSGKWGEEDSAFQPLVFADSTLITPDQAMIYEIQGWAKFERLNRLNPPDPGPLIPTFPQGEGNPPHEFDPILVDPSFVERIRLRPKDYTLLRESDRPEVYVFFGAARFHIPDRATATRLGLDLNTVGIVLPGSFQRNGIGEMPRHGTVLREETDPRVFVIRNGQKCHIASPTRLQELCLTWADVRLVPDGGLSHIPMGPPA